MITLRLFMENIAGDWFAWIENFPGAYSQGATQQEAYENGPRAFAGCLHWVHNHCEQAPMDLEGLKSADFKAEIVETVAQCGDPGAGVMQSGVTGFFAMDARPLASQEFELYLRLLRHARADLVQAATELPPHEWDSAPFGERSIRGLMQHLADSEMEMLNRLGIEPTLRTHPDPLLTLNTMRALFENAIRECFERNPDLIVSHNVERWSIGKVLRLALWHERYHTLQIASRSNPMAFMESITKAIVRDTRSHETRDSAVSGSSSRDANPGQAPMTVPSSDYYL